MYIKDFSMARLALVAFSALLYTTLTSSAPLYSQTVAGAPEQTVTVNGDKPEPGTAARGATPSMSTTPGGPTTPGGFAFDVGAPGTSVGLAPLPNPALSVLLPNSIAIPLTMPVPLVTDLPQVAIAPPELPLKGKTIVVNAGHGGRDSGAHYAGVMEKNITLKIALKVRDRLKELGATVIMTRTTDVDMSLAEIDAITARVQPDAFLAIHCNAGARNMRGIETFYFYPESSRYAALMLHTLAGRLGVRENFVHYNNFYVIDHTRVPATLVEVGYLSNKHDRAYMTSADGQETIAKALAEGEVKFFSKAKM